jgi:peptide chain release factor 1
MRGTGPGGQHRNVTDSKVVATHLPTGIQAASDDRSQYDNRRKALEVLAERVAEQYRNQYGSAINEDRKAQMEGERAFTWTEWRDSVTNHRTGRKAKMSRALKGQLDQLR